MKPSLDSKTPRAASRKSLLTAIRAAAKTERGNPLTFTKFLSTSKLRPQHIFRHFSRWNHALRAAGFEFERFNAPVTNARLLQDWGRCARKHRRIPTHLEYNLRARHSTTTFIKRFGAWSKVPEAFLAFAKKSANGTREWADVLALLPKNEVPAKPSRHRTPKMSATHDQASGLSGFRPPPSSLRPSLYPRPRRGDRRPARLPGRPICGDPLDFAGLRHAPANESGVIFLFGAMARDLGFVIDSLQAEFPDCHAKRLIAPGTWQPVRIEFEFESRNFRDHGHDPDACDIIVCWEHNWPECPEHIEVIALDEEIKRLGQHSPSPAALEKITRES